MTTKAVTPEQIDRVLNLAAKQAILMHRQWGRWRAVHRLLEHAASLLKQLARQKPGSDYIRVAIDMNRYIRSLELVGKHVRPGLEKEVQREVVRKVSDYRQWVRQTR